MSTFTFLSEATKNVKITHVVRITFLLDRAAPKSNRPCLDTWLGRVLLFSTWTVSHIQKKVLLMETIFLFVLF